ncbi:MAG: hypothetical protein ACKV2Q_26325 [Planctomycetaceae bacterium]
MSTAVRDLPSVSDQSAPKENLEQMIASYSSPQFTEALLEHFHEAKRRALGDIREAGLTPATEPEVAKS